MNRWWVLAVLGLLVVGQVWAKPSAAPSEEDVYPDDEGEDADDDGDDEGSEEVQETDVVFTTKPEDFRVRVGEEVRLPCAYRKSDQYAHTWEREGTVLSTGQNTITSDPRFHVSNDNSLVIRNASINDSSKNYTCKVVVTQSYNPSVTHRLLVIDSNELSPEIQVMPYPDKQIHAELHTKVTFGCKTNAQPKPKILFSHEGKKVHAHITETVDGTFVEINNVTRHHAGTYQCLVDINSDKPPTTAIFLSVSHKPEISLDQEYEIVSEGLRIKLICTVHAHPPAEVKWFKGERPLDFGPKYEVGREKPAKHFVSFLVDEEDLGKYTCRAANSLAVEQDDIDVNGAPSKPVFHHGKVLDDGLGLALQWKTISSTPMQEYKVQYRLKGEVDWKNAEPVVGNEAGQEFIIEAIIPNIQEKKYEAVASARNLKSWSPVSNVYEFRGDYKADRTANVVDPKSSSSNPAFFLSTTMLTITSLLLIIAPFNFACL